MYMDKRKSSYFIELITGCKEYIYYSIKDFKQDSDSVEHGRNGIHAFSKNKVNLKLKSYANFNMEFPNYFTKRIIEQTRSEVNSDSKNILLKDRTNCELVASLDILLFREYILKHPFYGTKLTESQNVSYDLLFKHGMDLKPILHYCKESKDIKIVGFCGTVNLQVEEKSSLEEKIKVIFRKSQFDN
jgi:hypothetical protein